MAPATSNSVPEKGMFIWNEPALQDNYSNYAFSDQFLMVVPRFDPPEVHSLDPDANPLPPCLENLNDQSFGEFPAGAFLSGDTAVTTKSYFPFSNIKPL